MFGVDRCTRFPVSARESPKLIIEFIRLHDDPNAVNFASVAKVIVKRILKMRIVLVFKGEEEDKEAMVMVEMY